MPDRADAWLAKATQDEDVARLIQAAGGPWTVAAYHLQQAAEKRLKAQMVREGIRPPKTHDLVELAESISLQVPLGLWDALRSLSVLAWTTRYPGFEIDTEEQYAELLAEYGLVAAWLADSP